MPIDLVNIPCLVLGGGGFIGRALVEALMRRGARVTGFGRIGPLSNVPAEIPWIPGDFADRVALARAIQGNEIVFHLLGGSTPESSNADPLSDLMAGAAATLALLEICRAEGTRKIVFASSGGTVYGIPQQVPIGENAATDPISAYGVNKLAVEKYLQLYRHLHGIDCAVLRVSNPFGPLQSPWRRQGLIANTIFKLLVGEPIEIWGDGSVVRDYVYIDDLVEAFVSASLYSGPHNVFNIGSGVGLSVKAVVEEVARVLGVGNIELTYKPSRPADVPINVLDITRAKAELSWSPLTPWSTAIGTTAEWMRSLPAVKARLESA